ncbi:MAG: YkvA family protein [Fusobacteriaceae bacterium]
MDNKEKKFFEKFKSDKISSSQLNTAQEKAGKLGVHAQDLLVVVSLVKDCISGKYKISKTDLAIFIGAIVYVVSPIDAVSDFIPIIGWLDDIGVFSYVSKNSYDLISDYKRFVSEEKVCNDSDSN